MRNKKRNIDKIIVEKMLKWCNQIEEFINRFGNNYDSYVKDMAFQCSTNMALLQIGELTTKLSETFKEKHDIVPWKLMRAVRNITAHDYESIEYEVMWQTLTEDIPKLKEQLANILNTKTNENNNDTL